MIDQLIITFHKSDKKTEVRDDDELVSGDLSGSAQRPSWAFLAPWSGAPNTTWLVGPRHTAL